MSQEQLSDSEAICVSADLQFAIDALRAALMRCTPERRKQHIADIRAIADEIDRGILRIALRPDSIGAVMAGGKPMKGGGLCGFVD